MLLSSEAVSAEHSCSSNSFQESKVSVVKSLLILFLNCGNNSVFPEVKYNFYQVFKLQSLKLHQTCRIAYFMACFWGIWKVFASVVSDHSRIQMWPSVAGCGRYNFLLSILTRGLRSKWIPETSLWQIDINIKRCAA